MSDTIPIIQANQSGVVLSGWLANPAWKTLTDLTGWTAKLTLLTLPGLTTAAFTRQTAVIDIANFDRTLGRVPVSFALGGLSAPVPLGSYEPRWIAIDPAAKEIAGPSPSLEQTIYKFVL